jgi:uncharacterized membrane protein
LARRFTTGAGRNCYRGPIRLHPTLLWFGLIVLVVFGVATAIARVLSIANVATSVTDARLVIARKLFPAYTEEIPKIEQRFADNAVVTVLHVVTGAAFLTLGVLQFSSPIRNRHLRFHRRSGYFLTGLAFLAGITGLWLGVVKPYSATERAPSAAAGAMFLVAPAIAVVAVRRGEIARHREWMIRFFAVGVGIVVIRLVGPVIIWLSSPVPFRDIVGLTFWVGWLVSVVVGEAWIRSTRADNRGNAPVTPIEV